MEAYGKRGTLARRANHLSNILFGYSTRYESLFVSLFPGSHSYNPKTNAPFPFIFQLNSREVLRSAVQYSGQAVMLLLLLLFYKQIEKRQLLSTTD